MGSLVVSDKTPAQCLVFFVTGEIDPRGWYWMSGVPRAYVPGSLHSEMGEAVGPFDTEQAAQQQAALFLEGSE